MVHSLLLQPLMVLLASSATSHVNYGWDHSIETSDYQERYDRWVQQGYRLVYVTGYEDESNVVRYNAIWHDNTDPHLEWTSSSGLTEAEYQQQRDEQLRLGFAPVFLDGFSVSDAHGRFSPRINVIYHKLLDPASRHEVSGQSGSELQAFMSHERSSGYILDTISTYQQDGSVRLAGTSSLSMSPYQTDWVGLHSMTLQQSAVAATYFMGSGYALDYLSAGSMQDSEPLFSAVFKKDPHQPPLAPDAPLPFVARINIDNLPAKANTWITEDYRPRVIDAYRTQNGSVRWGLLFERVEEELPEPEPNGETYPETACFDALVVDYLKQQQIPGASVAVLKDGNIVYSQGYGVRSVPRLGDVQGSPKVMPYTPFRVASVSKPITSLAVLRLVQQGRLSLSDRVFGTGGILQSLSDNPKPCCPIVDDRIEQITVRHLLTHTGGWTDNGHDLMIFNAQKVASTLGIAGPPSRDDYIHYMLGRRLKYAPGTTYAYSNFDFNLLARVIEQVTGVDYEQSVRELALDEAGVCREEMYSGSTQLKDVGEHEPRYFCASCPVVDSLFPSETDKVPMAYGGFHLEAFPASSGWVASAQQLMVMLSAVAPPHCNGTIPGQNTDACLLSPSVVDLVGTEKPAYCGPGDDSWHVDRSRPETTWHHSGFLAGTGSLMVRTDEYSFAFIANDGSYQEGSDGVMEEALRCVGDAWPSEFQVQSLCSQETLAP